MTQQAGESHAPQASSRDIDVLPAGDSTNRVDRFQDGSIVGVEPPFALRRCGIAPTNDEHLHATAYQVLHHALAWRQVHDVELVHLGRYHEQRATIHLGRRRLILDQLNHFVLEHDGPGETARSLPTWKAFMLTWEGRPPLLARSSSMWVRPRTRLAPPVSYIFFMAAGLPSRVLVGADGIGEEREHETRSVGILLVKIGIVDKGVEALLPGQIGLQKGVVKRIRFPHLISEAFVLRSPARRWIDRSSRGPSPAGNSCSASKLMVVA